MLKWFSGEEGEPGGTGPGSPRAAAPAGDTAAEMAERLAQTEQLVSQLKELIREKDATLRSKDDQLKSEKETCEAKLSKMRLQNKAKVTSLTSQLEDLKKQNGDVASPSHTKKGAFEGGEHASRGKIVLLKKKVEELDTQLKLREEELQSKRKELEDQRQRGEDMDAMLTEKDRKLSEKEAYIVHLQTALAGDSPAAPHVPVEVAAVQDLQLLVQSLTKKVGEADERYSLMLEQNNSLKELLDSEKQQYSQKENMYKENIQTFKDIIQQKDNQLSEINQIHEQELFKLAAKSDASADLEQLLKALKQKLHEKEEVLQGKNQVVDVLQGEVDSRDQQIQELSERLRRLHVERESLESKMEAEKHVMRAQVRDLMEKHRVEVQRITEQHQAETALLQQDLLRKVEELREVPAAPPACVESPATDDSTNDTAAMQKISELEAQTKQKSEEASRSEAKFLKMKAWSKSRIRQLEEELKKSQAGMAPPDLTALRSRVTALEEEREENLWKIEQYDDLRSQNEMLEAKLVVYEDQQRTLQAELEQFTKRATSQASESGSADDTQSHVLEWQEMMAEAVSARDQAREEKATMALRISHMEEEREELIEDDWFFPGCSDPALATRQQELEEELAQARGVDHNRAKKRALPAQRSLQEDFEFDAQFQEPRSPSESTTPMEGENMGGWWPEYSSPDTDGLRSVVEELEVERNQLQEQIVNLEERCQDLEDRLQLQARIEQLQNESEKLQSQLANVRSQQTRDAENHQLLVSSLNQQLKGLSSTQECLESSLIEKENTLAKTSEKLLLISGLQDSLSEKERQYKEASERLLQTESKLEDVSKKSNAAEKQCSEFKKEIDDLTQKLSAHKEKTLKQEVTIETLQTELDQTNEDLDKLNSAHLEERAQLIHDLQNCEREMDSLKEILVEKDKEIAILSGNMVEFGEQVAELKQELKVKEESLVQLEKALGKAEREAKVLRDSQSSDQESLNGKIADLLGKLKDAETELLTVKGDNESKMAEVEALLKQVEENKKTIQVVQAETQRHVTGHQVHLSECETHVASIKEQLRVSHQELEESNAKHEREIHDKEQVFENQLKSFKEEQNKLLVQIEECNSEIHSLSQQLQEREQSLENVRKEVQDKTEAMLSLENKYRESDEEQQKLKTAVEAKDGEHQELSEELLRTSENSVKLNNELLDIKAEKEKMQETIHNLNEVAERQKQEMTHLNEKLSSALEVNHLLEEKVQQITKDKELLHDELASNRMEKDSLNTKITDLEKEQSENVTAIRQLEEEKEAFASKANDLTRVLEESSNSNSEILLARTNECSQLSHMLKEKEETVSHLQGEVQSLLSEVDQLRQDIKHEQQMGADLQLQIKVLQEKESALQTSLENMDEMLKQAQQERDGLQEEFIQQKKALCDRDSEVKSLSDERSRLSLELKVRDDDLTKQGQLYKDQLNEANQMLKSKSDQIRQLEEDIQKMELEAESKQTELTNQEMKMREVEEENRQLHENCHSKVQELQVQQHLVSDLESQLKDVTEQNSSLGLKVAELTDSAQKLQDELTLKMLSISELTAEIGLLQETKAALEMNISDNEKKMNGLLNEKEELSAVSLELKRILQERELSLSGDLLEKGNECNSLSTALQEKEEQIRCLTEDIKSFEIQVGQLSVSASEKEKIISEKSSQLEAQRSQMLQVQDTMTMLQEQGSVLKSGLLEKEKLFQEKAEESSLYQKEASQQKDLVALLQKELEAVGGEVSELKLQVVQKEQILSDASLDYQSQKAELEKREETIISLSTQLGAMNEKCAKMEEEVDDLKTEKHELSVQLKELGDKSRADVTDLEENIQAINEQNKRLKSELQKTVTDLSQECSKVEYLTSSLNNQKIQMETAFSENERAQVASQKQHDDRVQQLISQIGDQDQLLKERGDEITHLQESLSPLRKQVEILTFESSRLKSDLEMKEQSRQEYQSNSLTAVENLNARLHDKESECESLKEKMAHLEESVAKINNSLQSQTSESETLKQTLEDRESRLSSQLESLNDLQKRVEESSLFRVQFMESTELVSQLKSQLQHQLSEAENHKRCSEEIQSAFNNIQDKYVATLEELQKAKTEISRKTDEVSSVKTQLDESNCKNQQALLALQSQCSSLELNLESAQEQNRSLTKEKDEAFASHQDKVSQLTFEIENLKSQLLQVAGKMNALTENLEQREMALHVINSQCTNQAKHTSQLVSEIERVEALNKILSEELSVLRGENQTHLSTLTSENARLQEELAQHVLEKEALERRHSEILESQRTLKTQVEQQSSSLTDLQAEVSAKDEELSRLKTNVQNVEHILQDSEKEWLLVLDKEKQEKSALVEQLNSVEYEMKSKDVKFSALKQDLDGLQEKLAEASSAVRSSSDQLSMKESEASTSRVQLEKMLASIQEKNDENVRLHQTLSAVELDLKELLQSNIPSDPPLLESPCPGVMADLQHLIKQIERSHRSEVGALKEELQKTVSEYQSTKTETENGHAQKVLLLQQNVEALEKRLAEKESKIRESADRQASLQLEAKRKDDQIDSMHVQVSQQKELLTGLTQQVRDKDASVAQLLQSAANERVTLSEENSSLKEQLESMALTHASAVMQLEEQISSLRVDMQTNSLERVDLINENESLKASLDTVSKEKDGIKKKLQAALVVRKELLRKIEDYEKEKGENVKYQSEVLQLQDRIQCINSSADCSVKMLEDKLSLLEKELEEKEAELLEQKTKCSNYEQVNLEKGSLEVVLNETEECLSEKTALVLQLQTAMAERQVSYEHEKHTMAQTLEALQNELKTCKEEKESLAADAELERELSQLKQEKATLQKKAQAALIARKETMKKAQEQQKKLSKDIEELKDSNKQLLERQSLLTNQLATLQSDLEMKTKALDEVSQMSSSYLKELGSLQKLVEEKDKAIQDLKGLLKERDDQCVALSNVQAVLDQLRSDYESLSRDLAKKEEALAAAEKNEEDFQTKMSQVERKLEKAVEDLEEKVDEVKTYQESVKGLELKLQQERSGLEASKLELEQLFSIEARNQGLLMENKALSEESQIHQQMLTDAKQRLMDSEQSFSEELKKALHDCSEMQEHVESLTKRHESDSVVISDLRALVTKLNSQIKEHGEMPLIEQESVTPAFQCAADIEAALKQKDDALLVAQGQVLEKDELISALEHQLQQQIQSQEFAVNQMKTEVEELRRSQEDNVKLSNQDNQSKMNQLTKKLQAALVSRKELMKEKSALKEGMEKLSIKYGDKESQYSALETSYAVLKQKNEDLGNTCVSQKEAAEKLGAEFDRVLHDNRSLSSACDVLKQTIESITQQKEAFSCQLESLKDSQTEELNQWRTKHAELKQDYESLLQDYENVSSEMDKMRQLLEEAKRDRREARSLLHQHEIEMGDLRRKAEEVEGENSHIKEKMHSVLKEKRQKIKELEQDNDKMKKELTEIDAIHRQSVAELTSKNDHLEAELCALQRSTEDFDQQLRKMTTEKDHLNEKLEEASISLESRRMEAESCSTLIQQKLDEALDLNNSLTAQLQSLKTELGAQVEINNLLQKEKQRCSGRIESLHNEHELQLRSKEEALNELQRMVDRQNQEAISLNEKVRILEDDKSLLQEELENVQELSDKVKNENEYLETVILKNSDQIDELTETVKSLHTQNSEVAAQLAASKEMNNQVCQEKDKEQLKLVRELEEKLRTVKRGSEGSKNVKRELQELLKEKHREINQLQKDCVNYQEVILELESSLKTSKTTCEQLEKEVEKNSVQISDLENGRARFDIALADMNKLLQKANEKVRSVQLEKDQLTLEISLSRKKTEELKLQESKDVIFYKENQSALKQQIADLRELIERESQRSHDLQQQIESRDLQINTLKRTIETTEAKLEALSSTPHGADAAKLWSDRYQKTLHEKDNQLLEQGYVIKKFLEDTRLKEKETHELHVTKSRLERSLNEYSVAAAAQQRQLFVLSASNAELAEKVELLTLQVKGLGAQAEVAEQDRNQMNRQLIDNEDVISRLKLHLQQLEKVNAETDAQRELLQTQADKLRVDFEMQEGITQQLKSLLNGKDAEISSLLSCKDGHMSEYLEQLKQNYHSQIVVFEKKIAELQETRQKADKDFRVMEAKFRSVTTSMTRIVQEKDLMAEKVESLKSSVTSLQSERERLTSENRVLKRDSQLGLRDREGLAEGEGNKGLKHEIRKMLHQMDDLNSENAMLRAQLVRYREDLNQVLSLKDNQLKVLLKKQQDTIKNLENQKAAVERQQRESQLGLQQEEETRNALQSEVSNLQSQVNQLQAALLSQKATDEGKVICDLQQAITAKASECHDLQRKLHYQKQQSNELAEQLTSLRSETDKKLVTAEEKYNSELEAFEHEVELMRNQQETADQRVAELTRDLLEVEQQLSDAKTSGKNTSAQNESLCKAMSALQDDRDKLIEDFKILRNRYDEELQDSRMALNKTERGLLDAVSDLAMISKERDVLADRLKAFESKDSHRELNKLLGELTKTVSEKEKQLKQAASENTTYSRQLSAFSKSMVSLQNDRDRLVDELAEATRVKQGSSLEATLSSSVWKSTGYGPSGFRIEKRGPLTNELHSAQKVDTQGLQSGFDTLNDQKQELRSDQGAQLVKETVVLAAQSAPDDTVAQLEAERLRLHRDLQRCLYEIQQRDQYLQQLNTKLQQATEEKGEVATQLRAVSQTLRDTQNRCHWLENHIQVQQGSVYTEVAPGAPQERNNDSISESSEAHRLRERLLEAEQRLADETCRRETAEEALRLAEDTAKRVLSREGQRSDISIDMEAEEEWDAFSLDPNQPLISRKVKGGMMACRRWIRGRSLYFSRLLTSRGRSRYFFLAYMLMLHVLVFMCVSGAL
ncbi:uncharacterized protein ACB057_008021 [Neosynchiropus ocellatus]